MSVKRMQIPTKTTLGHDFLLPLDSMSASKQDPSQQWRNKGALRKGPEENLLAKCQEWCHVHKV